MPADCAEIIAKKRQTGIAVIENKQVSFSKLKPACSKLGFKYSLICDKLEITNHLSNIDEPTLVLSVNNQYIFPNEILANKLIRCVNFHGGLLPRYPGNGDVIPSWVIFNKESVHGATWHSVSDEIDAGSVICQDSFELNDNETATHLMMRVIKVGINLFSKNWESFWCHSPSIGTDSVRHMKVYRRKDLPNNGFFDTTWTFALAERFLRSMDTRPLNFISNPKVVENGKIFRITSYRVRGDLMAETIGYKVAQIGSTQQFSALHMSPDGVIEMTLEVD